MCHSELEWLVLGWVSEAEAIPGGIMRATAAIHPPCSLSFLA